MADRQSSPRLMVIAAAKSPEYGSVGSHFVRREGFWMDAGS